MPAPDGPAPDGPAPDVLAEVERHLHAMLGPDVGRGSVSFVGADPVQVLRFGPDEVGVVRYVTLGLSGTPMGDPAAVVADPDAPRAELVLSIRGRRDEVLRPLAVLAASPLVEGVVITPGAGLDVGAPLWPDARVSAVLVAEPGGLVSDLTVPGVGAPVRFLPLLPMTAEEAAYKRVHGAEALEERWLGAGTDLRDPLRRGVDLDPDSAPPQ